MYKKLILIKTIIINSNLKMKKEKENKNLLINN